MDAASFLGLAAYMQFRDEGIKSDLRLNEFVLMVHRDNIAVPVSVVLPLVCPFVGEEVHAKCLGSVTTQLFHDQLLARCGVGRLGNRETAPHVITALRL